MADRIEQLTAAIELSLIPGLGNIAQARLWAQYHCLPDIFAESGGPPLADAQAREAIAARRYRAAAEEILDWAGKEDCLFLLRGDELYPALLEEIPDPPCLLYARGSLDVLREPCVSIVGRAGPRSTASRWPRAWPRTSPSAGSPS